MLPSNPTLVDIADRIADGQITANYQFYFILLVLAVIAALVLWFVAPYLGERGKLLAAAETLKARLDEIRDTTAVAEHVRTNIARSDWTIKEYKTLKRNQLEHLLSTAFKLMLASEADAKFQDNEASLKLESREFMIELKKTAALYFSELKVEADELIDTHASLAIKIIKSRSLIRMTKLELEHERSNQASMRQSTMLDQIAGAQQRERCKKAETAYNDARLKHVDECAQHIQSLTNAVDRLQARSTKLMQELITPETHTPPSP
jgi:hypothetical protein